MKTVILLCAVVAAAVAYPAETYNPAYDSFDAEEVAGNVRLLKNYGNCFLDKGPCTPQGLDFKKVISEALSTSCGKCSPKQRHLVRVMVNGFKTKQPELWGELVDKYDPQKQYTEAFNKFLNESN